MLTRRSLFLNWFEGRRFLDEWEGGWNCLPSHQRTAGLAAGRCLMDLDLSRRVCESINNFWEELDRRDFPETPVIDLLAKTFDNIEDLIVRLAFAKALHDPVRDGIPTVRIRQALNLTSSNRECPGSDGDALLISSVDILQTSAPEDHSDDLLVHHFDLSRAESSTSSVANPLIVLATHANPDTLRDATSADLVAAKKMRDDLARNRISVTVGNCHANITTLEWNVDGYISKGTACCNNTIIWVGMGRCLSSCTYID